MLDHHAITRNDERRAVIYMPAALDAGDRILPPGQGRAPFAGRPGLLAGQGSRVREKYQESSSDTPATRSELANFGREFPRNQALRGAAARYSGNIMRAAFR